MTDDELFELLGRAIGPRGDEAPSDAERAALRSHVEVVLQRMVVPITAGRRSRWLRRGVAAGIAGVVIVAGTTTVAALANDGVLPAPARAVARSVGLPVESAELAEARAALRRLRHADGDGRAAAAHELREALAKLSPGELAKIEADALAALAAADVPPADTAAPSASGPGPSDSSGSGSPGAGPSGPDSSGTASAATSDSSGSESSDSGSSGSGGSGSSGSDDDSVLGGSGSGGSGSSDTSDAEDGDGDHDSTTSTTSTNVTSTTTSNDSHDGSDDGESSTTTISSSGHDGDGDGHDGGR